MIVVDTSVATKWIVTEPGHEVAIALLETSFDIVAPDLLLPEISNVLRRKVRLGEISTDQAQLGIAAVRASIQSFISSVQLADEALRLSEQLDHSPYDCFFLAAELGRGVLVTADDVFRRKCSAAGFGQAVVDMTTDVGDRLSRQLALQDLTPERTAEIVRLASKMAETFENLKAVALKAIPAGRLKVIPPEAYAPAFDLPAYRRLRHVIHDLPHGQRPLLLALGWLGRARIRVDEFSALLANAELLLADGWETHERYFISVMGGVASGLQKLQNEIDTESGQ